MHVKLYVGIHFNCCIVQWVNGNTPFPSLYRDLLVSKENVVREDLRVLREHLE